MTLKVWLLFLSVETALSLSPGPAVFYVAAQGMRGGSRSTLPATAGILTVNGLFFVLSATGVGAMIASSAAFFSAARWIGAAYLVYLGIKALRSEHALHSETPVPPRGRGIFMGAVMLQAANPKALLFFLALLPQFIDPSQPIALQMCILAATSMVPEFLILVGYGWLAHRAARTSSRFAVKNDTRRWLARIEGVGLLGCAALVLKVGRGG